MAKKATTSVSSKKSTTKAAAPKTPVAVEVVKSAPAKSTMIAEVSQDLIAQRAYEIWRSSGGSDLENWLRAERELNGTSGSSAR